MDYHLPIDYNPRDYAPIELLEEGNIDIWVRRREAILIAKAKDTALDCEASKMAGLGLMIMSAVLSANPLMVIPLAVGMGGYVYTLFQERQDIGSIKPIPMYRGSIGNLMGAVEGNRLESQHPYFEQIAYLSAAEKDEALMISCRFKETCQMLAIAPPKVRFDLYQYAAKQFHLREILPSHEEVQAYVTHAVSSERRTAVVQPKPEDTATVLPSSPTPNPLPVGPNTKLKAQEVPATNVTPSNSRETLEATGGQAIDDLAYTTQSVIFLGTPGAGKSTSLGVMLGRTRKRYGDKLKLYALAMKNDSFGGAVLGQLNVDSDACWSILQTVITELRKRASMSSVQRKAYCEQNPIKLILDDYASQQRQYDTVLKEKKVEYPEANGCVNVVRFGDAVEAVLSEIVFNGRELCVSALVSTQSANITDLPFLSSKSGRASIILIVQALKNVQKRQGNYEVISQSISNPQLIAGEDERRQLKELFNEAKELSFKHQLPLLLTSNSDAGEYTLGLVPNLVNEYEGYETEFSSQEVVNKLDKMDKTQDLVLEDSEKTQAFSTSTREAFNLFDELKPDVRTILIIVREAKKPLKTRDIQMKKKKELEGLDSQQIKNRLDYLVDRGFLRMLGDGSYETPSC